MKTNDKESDKRAQGTTKQAPQNEQKKQTMVFMKRKNTMQEKELKKEKQQRKIEKGVLGKDIKNEVTTLAWKKRKSIIMEKRHTSTTSSSFYAKYYGIISL